MVLLIRRTVRPRGYASGVHSPAALPGKRRAWARRGWVGEKGEHFEQPIGPRMQNQDKEGNLVYRMMLVDSGLLSEEERPIESGDGDGDEFDRQQQSAHNGVRCGGR